MDLFLVYSLIKRLSTPFEEWDAFERGIIDKDGNILRPRRTLSIKERATFSKYDLMILKLKKLLEKVPGGKSRLGSYAAALWLIKEGEEFRESDIITEESVQHYMEVISEDVDVRFDILHETLTVGSGAIAGLEPDEPPVSKKKQKKYKKENRDGSPY